MSRAHMNSLLGLQDILVPVDNNTIGLWHFDKTMYSTNVIRPWTNTAYLQSGKFGNVVLIQEAMTNMYPGPASPGLYMDSAYNGAYGFGTATNSQWVIDNSITHWLLVAVPNP